MFTENFLYFLKFPESKTFFQPCVSLVKSVQYKFWPLVNLLHLAGSRQVKEPSVRYMTLSLNLSSVVVITPPAIHGNMGSIPRGLKLFNESVSWLVSTVIWLPCPWPLPLCHTSKKCAALASITWVNFLDLDLSKCQFMWLSEKNSS
jgi:hypothetical protein